MNPDFQGKSCNFIQHGLKLPNSHGGSMPYFPLYRMDEGPICDSTIRFPQITWINNEDKRNIKISPNPASSYLYIQNLKIVSTSKMHLRLIDLNGNILFSEEFINLEDEIKIPIDGFPTGMLFVQIRDFAGNYWNDKFIKI